jgi:hypothetical protein
VCGLSPIRLRSVQGEKMTRGPSTFKGNDLKRAIRTAKEAGLEVKSFEITKAGSIIVHIGNVEAANDDGDEWDKALSP